MIAVIAGGRRPPRTASRGPPCRARTRPSIDASRLTAIQSVDADGRARRAGRRRLAAVVWRTGAGRCRRPVPARPQATVVHRVGFEATVLGWTSWYGSYDLGPLGAGWCIDHGLRAPTRLRLPADASDRSARRHPGGHGLGGDHGQRRHRSGAVRRPDAGPARPARRDLSRSAGSTSTPCPRASWPGSGARSGRHRPGPAIKADALAHAGRRGPLHLAVQTHGDRSRLRPGGRARLTDADGAGHRRACSVDAGGRRRGPGHGVRRRSPDPTAR